jgi:hypothetical protein
MNPLSDLRAVEGRLRAGLHDPSWPGQIPDADDLLRHVVRARRRRPTLIAACLAILVVAAGATYVVAGGSLRAAPPVSGTTTASPTPSDFALSWPPQVYFADGRHGFAVLKSCASVPTHSPLPNGQLPRDCPIYVAATDDGGLSWRPRAVPGVTAPDRTDLGSSVLSGADADHLALQPQLGGSAVFSADGGRTWTALPAAVGTVDEVPAGGIAVIIVGRTGPGPDSVTVIGPDGVTARLAHPPAIGRPVVGIGSEVGVAADGALWIHVMAEGLPSWDFVSRDHGRTWFEVHGPTGTGALSLTSGPNLFAADETTHTLWTSKDGQRWDQVPLPFSTAGAVHLAYEPRADGSLLIGDVTHGRTYLIPAGTLQVTEVPVDEHMFAQHVGSGCIKAVGPGAPFNFSSTRPTAYDFAPDCVHWGRFPFPVG